MNIHHLIGEILEELKTLREENALLRHEVAALHAKLATLDPATAARLAPGDSQRIGRALEVWTATGQTLSSFHQRAKAHAPAPELRAQGSIAADPA